MGHIIRPNYSGSNHYDRRSGGGLIRNTVGAFTDVVRQYGVKGLAALIVAALFAFAPLTLLYWFNSLRFSPVVAFEAGQRILVKPGRYQREQEDDEPGETALLQVTCADDRGQDLLQFDDPARPRGGVSASSYVRREAAYVRPMGLDPAPPFALLGTPPVSAWLPAGDYEVLVVHEAPRAEQRIDGRSHGFPLVSALAEVSLANRRKTVCRVPLPHYDWGSGTPLELTNTDGLSADRAPYVSELGPLLRAYESVTALPTPGGYVLALAEPVVHHDEEHRHCTIDFADLHAVPREWTREQIATVRNWLPDDAGAARARLSALVDALEWREFFQGWFCYAAAGVAGLVFTRWGALAMLEPWRRRESFKDSLALLVKIFFVSITAWFAYHVLTDSPGCSGPVPFRIR